jgi:hypothetical protein
MITCACVQPCYIPWRGYFDQIARSDVFIFYDHVQYDKYGWRNRNFIKGASGKIRLTIPVLAKGNVAHHRAIKDIVIAPGRDWARKHWRSIAHAYSRAPYFAQYAEQIETFYTRPCYFLSDFTIDLTILISRKMGLEPVFLRSSSIRNFIHGKTRSQQVISMLKSIGATRFVIGPTARKYMDEAEFERGGIDLIWMKYSYPDYPQFFPPFDPHVSILDLLFQVGPRSGEYIWGREQ